MSVHNNIGKRMKEFYEYIPSTKLMRRTPVAIRIDGKAFHTLTRGFKRPFDDILIGSMQQTMKYLCENIQGCVLGYTQSDEITLILIDYKNLNSSAWFDYEVQKMCSVAASMATMAFNRAFSGSIKTIATHFHLMESDQDKEILKRDYGFTDEDLAHGSEFWNKRWERYQMVCESAMFDARVFNIPKEEVANLLYWRQVDAIRNSIQMVGRANFSHGELHGKSRDHIKEMLLRKKGIDWNNLPTHKQRGSCCIKMYQIGENVWAEQPYESSQKVLRTKWCIDTEIPVFMGEGRNYIDRLISF